MHLELTIEQAQALNRLLEQSLRELSHEIAATDNAEYRAAFERVSRPPGRGHRSARPTADRGSECLVPAPGPRSSSASLPTPETESSSCHRSGHSSPVTPSHRSDGHTRRRARPDDSSTSIHHPSTSPEEDTTWT